MPDPITESILLDAKREELEAEKTYEKGLEKTRTGFGAKLNSLLANFRTVDEEFFEELEETLITSDVGYELALEITEDLRREVKLEKAKSTEDVQNVIIEKMIDIYEQDEVKSPELNIEPNRLNIILFVGVNGVGKTTTIGKLATKLQNDGHKILTAAADTFRAGAINQLIEWGRRGDFEVVAKPEGSDPAAVVFDALTKAKQENYDILLVDTAGRLQNKENLMAELAKIHRIIEREIGRKADDVLLVLDATTGQNALSQAKAFTETTDVTGLVLTKMDGSAKGGVVLGIHNAMNIPVKLIGFGEGIDDLKAFDMEAFAYGLFKGLIK
ncbi:MAG: signal recognition particle-docking protein FtsY [Lactobacillales bacterium]|nr:signal recognition particle-docking protein FtsY [Lactobacillales bacterium]